MFIVYACNLRVFLLRIFHVPLDFTGRESTEQLTQSAPLSPVVGNGIVVVEEEKAELNEPWEKDPRLPKHLIPLHYELYLHPNLNTGLFNGNNLMNSY